jgi:hypothetical protein
MAILLVCFICLFDDAVSNSAMAENKNLMGKYEQEVTAQLNSSSLHLLGGTADNHTIRTGFSPLRQKELQLEPACLVQSA